MSRDAQGPPGRPPEEVRPVRHLGRARLVAVGLNSVVGGGIFILPATVAALAGAASIAGYVLAGLVVLGVGLSLASLAARHEASGGPYLYVQRAFGSFAGYQVGWLFCLARLSAMANLLNGVAQYLGDLLPWAARPGGRVALIASCASGIVAVNILGIRQTSSATNVFAAAKLLPLAVLGVFGLGFVERANFAPVAVAPMDLLRAVLLLIFAFTGFEILTVPAEESLRPGRDIPTALVITILVVCGVHLLVHTVALGMLPHLGREAAPLATAAGVIAGPAGRAAMTAIAATSMAGCALASLLGGTRLLYAMSRARQIPDWMGAIHPRFRTPVGASLLIGGLAALFAILSTYATLAAISAGTRLLVYLACCLACLRGAPPGSGPADSPGRGRRAVALATAVAIAALLCGLKGLEAGWGLAGVGIGTALYALGGRAR